MSVTIRHMYRDDIETVSQIEIEAFADPWIGEVIAWSVARQEASGLVATIEGHVVGYVIYHLEGKGADSYVRISRLAVVAPMRRCGIGELLLEAVEDRLTLVRRKLVFPVRESNLAAQQWLKHENIECQEIRSDYFADGEAAYVFALEYQAEEIEKLIWSLRE
jgi:ribosomal protein S18 acetylase RimI-like enzyme